MSQRGAFVTEFMYCGECFEAVRDLLNSPIGVQSCSIANDSILTGAVLGSYPGEEVFYFDTEIRDKIEEKICHHVQIAVLAESQKGVVLDFLPKWEISNLSEDEYALYMQSDLDWPNYRIKNNIKC